MCASVRCGKTDSQLKKKKENARILAYASTSSHSHRHEHTHEQTYGKRGLSVAHTCARMLAHGCASVSFFVYGTMRT